MTALVLLVFFAALIFIYTISVGSPSLSKTKAEQSNEFSTTPVSRLQDGRRMYSGSWADTEFFVSNSRAEQLNVDPPTTHILYSNESFGISRMILPFNPHWGSPTLAVPPYNEDGLKKAVKFGPLIYLEGNIDRAFILQITSHRTPNDIYDDLHSGTIKDLTTSNTKAGYPLFRYTQDIDEFYGCNVSLTELVGKDYNYVFAPPCQQTYTPTQQAIDQIVSELVLL